MFLSRKYFFLFLACILTATMGYTQEGRVALQAAGLKNFPARLSVSHTLAKRVENTYYNAQKAQLATKNLLPMGFFVAPAKSMKPYLHASPQELYPQATFLSSRRQLSDYFLSLNNRKALSFLKEHQRRLEGIQQHLEDFKKGCRSILEGEEMNWVVSQIPDDTSLLLLGEAHYIDDIKLNVLQLIQGLREKYPHRHIVLFTEFMPQGSVFGQEELLGEASLYTPIWAIAHNLGIPTIGLEPAFVAENDPCSITYNRALSADAWTSYEGLRLRNTHWAKLIKDFQEQMIQAHPEMNDMLIIIYAGAGHTEYGMPYSLANMFPHEKIFSVSLYPTYLKSNSTRIYEDVPFDVYSNGLLATDRAVQFKNPELVRLFGSHIRVKVEPTHRITAIGLIVPKFPQRN